MSLPDVKQLDKLIRLCRKRGVSTIKIDNIELTLGDAPSKAQKVKAPLQSLGVDEIESDGPKGDDLLFWSTGVLPQDTENPAQ